MLTPEENELLTRTGPGTPMGRFMRHYWIPALFSEQLPDRDGPPVRVKLLGERLVAFRATDGRVALVDERCPHRGASMFFGRNEAGEDNVGGLRCVYHGWKFDPTGQCVDMPSEPAVSSRPSNFKSKVSITAYPCEEHGGIVWTYMGPPGGKPAFPQLEWAHVPPAHRFATRHLQECNWFQAFEGGFDTSHVSFLHRGDRPNGALATPARYEDLPTDFGFVSAAGRITPEGTMHWLANVMFVPFHKLITRFGGPDAPIGAHAWVPVDDEHCMIWSVEYHPDRPLEDQEMARSRAWQYIHAEMIPGTDLTVANKSNDYLVDRALQKSGKSFTGIPGFGMQDCGIQESMGTIADRTREHLGTSDTVIIQLRRQMLRAVRDMEAGKPLPGLDPASYRVRSAGFTTPLAVKFEDVVMQHVRVEPQVA